MTASKGHLEATPSLPPEGVPFGRYMIRKRIAKGGMGEVLLADQVGPLGPVRPVALKRMLPRLARDPRASRMFLDEMALAAQLNHPNIATTYDFGEVDGMYFIAMEYVEGLSLHDLLGSIGPLPVAAGLAIVAQVAEALSYAHTRKNPQSGELAPVVHRDVSPHNVMISSSGSVKLLDFGIARAEQALVGGRLEGKLNYAAPEQLQGEPPERRSDLWALGVVLYEALTAVRPFERDNPVEMLSAAISQSYTPLESLRPEAEPVQKVVARALLKDPTRRWPTAEGFRAACLEALEGFGGSTPQTLAQLVAQAGGPRKSVLGVEAFTSLNLGAKSGLDATLDPLGGSNSDSGPGPGSGSGSSPSRAAIMRTPTRLPNGREAMGSVATGSGFDPDFSSAIAPPRAPRFILAAVLGVGAAIGIFAFIRPTQPVVVEAASEVGDPIVIAPLKGTPSEPQVEKTEAAKPEAAKPDAVKPEAVKPVTKTAKPVEAASPSGSPDNETRRADAADKKGAKRGSKKLSKSDKKRLSAKALPSWEDAPEDGASESPSAAESRRTEEPTGVGLLSVRAVPWAKVTLDGRLLGNSPLANLPVQAGTHTIVLTPNQGDFAPRTSEIRVRAGSPTRVVVDFQANKLSLDQP